MSDSTQQGLRHTAQQRSDEIHGFRRELDRLHSEHVLTLTPQQHDAVRAHHDALLSGFVSDFDIDRNQQARQLSLGMRAASFLGALALAASIFFLFYQFWGYFNELQQVVALVVAALGTLTLTFWIRSRDASGYFTKLAALVAFACFVLNISMLGQIFNLTPTDRALIPWAALALMLAYACNLRLLLAAGICCVIALIAARVGAWGGIYWLHAGERPENFFPAAILMLVLPHFLPHHQFPGFAALYRVFGLLCVLLPMLILGHWGHGSHLDLDVQLIEGGYQLAGFVVSALAIWAGTRYDWPETMNTGLSFFVILLYTKFFDWWWELMPKYVFFLLLGLSAVLILMVLKRLRAVHRTDHRGVATGGTP